MVFLGPRGQHLPLRRRRAPGGPGPLRVPPVLEPVPDLLVLDGDLAGAGGGGGELLGEALDDVALRDGVVEVAEVLLHLRHLRVREPERGAPAARRPPHPPPPALLRVAR